MRGELCLSTHSCEHRMLSSPDVGCPRLGLGRPLGPSPAPARSPDRPASHYRVYQKQHRFNSNPHWDFGAFRRLGHLVRETQVNFSRFVHQFLDPGTYVFRDNALPESIVVVSVKEKGIACGPGLSSVQPCSPYQLSRHGIVRHRLPTLGPDWAVITGVLLAVGLATALLTGLGLVLSPPLAQTCPVRAWRLRERGLREPHVPADCVRLRDSLTVREDLGPQGSGEGASCRQRAVPRDTGEPHPVNTLEDFSVRTLYDKLEDQSLHLVAQLSKHRSDALAFYRGASQQLQGLKDFLQGLSMTERQDMGRGGDLEMGAKATARTDTGQREEWCSGHTAASPRVRWQHPLGGTPSMSPLGFQSKLDRMIAALASALSHARGQPARAQQKGDRFPKGLCVQNNYPVSLTPWRFSRHTQACTRSHSHACAHYTQPHTCTITFTHAMHHTLRPYIHTPHMQTHALTHRYMTTHMHTFPLLQTTHIHMCTYITHSHMTYTYTHYTTHSHSLRPHTLQVALHSGLKPRCATCAHRFTPGFGSGSPPRRLWETIFPAC
ncbi:uncharacterized protein [Equus przewalskii]|uniref:Uncharacterized protein isoform X2 n=1 Tax=Equus przewalskii TaxID=9798 RepID=A0ABM4L967_EQUPR